MSSTTRRVLKFGLVAFILAGVLAITQRYRFGAVGPGAMAPEIALSAFGSDEVTTLSDLQETGTVTLVNFWATDCPPCIAELASMQRLYDEFSSQGFEILALSQDGSPGWRRGKPLTPIPGDEADQALAAADPFDTPRRRVEWWVQSFQERYGLTFPILMDWEGAAWDDYQISGLPESFLIGADGRIYQKVYSSTEWDSPTQVALVERLLSGG
jgi:peroxiredoxin